MIEGTDPFFTFVCFFRQEGPMQENKSVTIDVDAILKNKFGERKIPGPIRYLIRRILHQDDFNEYFRKGDVGYEFVEGFIRFINVRIDVIGQENIPAQGRFTFVSNHPLGMLDAGFETAWLARRYNGNVAVPANDFMMSIKQVGAYLIPVNKVGAQDRSLGEILNDAFRSDRQILFFPAGSCSRQINGVITDTPWKKTFLTRSRETQRDIIPIWFSGQNSKRFYRIAKWCKRLGIKTNYAMYTLPDELFRSRGKQYKMVIGKPIPYTIFTPDKTDSQWVSYVRDQVYSLKQD